MPRNKLVGTAHGQFQSGKCELETRRPVMNMIKNFLRNSKGATAIEYGLIAALIAVAGIAAFQAVGSDVRGTFNEAAAAL